MERTEPELCYLCGLPMVDGQKRNRDHIPMDQLLAPELRSNPASPIQLVTREVHKDCNSSYKLDEEYFVQCLIPFGRGSVAGDAIWQRSVNAYRAGKRRPLVHKVLNSATSRTSGGIILPSRLVNLALDWTRFNRVVSKLVRGQHFADTGAVIPPDMEMDIHLFLPDKPPPIEWQNVLNLPLEDKGNHKGVWCYRSYTDGPRNLWLLLIWDRIIIGVTFEDPLIAEDAVDLVE